MSYSQSGEDRYLIETVFCNQAHQGKFVDIGADDGIRFSNSYLFERLGWTGICVEPVFGSYLLCNNARNCKVINAAIIGDADPGPFIVDPDHHDISGFRRTNGEEIFPQLLKLDDIITEPIDLLSIDTEGTEVDILQAFSFRYPPKVIVAEYDTIHLGRCDEQLIALMHSKQYALINRFQFNLIFIKV